jgi:hypothetical protein
MELIREGRADEIPMVGQNIMEAAHLIPSPSIISTTGLLVVQKSCVVFFRPQV